MDWFGGRKRAEARRARALEEAKDIAYAAWSDAIKAHNAARESGDTRTQNRTFAALYDALHERMRLGC